MMELLAKLLSLLMRPCWKLTKSYIPALFFFTILTRVILLPVNLWVQKNSITLVKMMPEINRIKIAHYGDKDTIAEQRALVWKREGYSPLLDLLPLILQLILLAGVIGVVRDPTLSGMKPADMISWGIDLRPIPAEEKGWYILFPCFAGLASLLMCVVQNHAQVLQAQQSALNRYGLTALSVAISVYLGLYVRAGVAVYWILGSLIAIPQQYLLNLWMDPQKAVDYPALRQTEQELRTMEKVGEKRAPALKKRERADYKSFFSVANKHLVFHSEGSGFYKYYEAIIAYLLSHSNLTIHYITQDPEDQIFSIAKEQPRIRPYYIGENRLITLMMKMDADVLVMTAPDLQTYHIKRSLVRDDVEYVYVDHGVSSLNLMMREGCVDHYDTILCVGPHEVEEIRAREAQEGLRPKKLIPCGYSLLAVMEDAYRSLPKLPDQKTRILIAPSHQEANIMDSCLEPLTEQFLQKGYLVTIRPHPQYIRRNPSKMERIRNRWAGVDNVTLEEDFSSNETVLRADLLVTDWSNISMEYAYATLRPVLFIDTPLKEINPNWRKLGIEPVDFAMRREMGLSVDPKEIEKAGETAEQLLLHRDDWRSSIENSLRTHVFCVRDAGEKSGAYLIQTLLEKQKKRKANVS